ncbi:MAG: hypothetical protein H6642_16640 [Caldilineaceae bacterium]|nr:hypothetical protein [Caldilineaceae bacterium]
MTDYMDVMNRSRRENGFKTIDELIVLSNDNTVFDLFSVLIGASVEIGSGNMIYPNVLIQATNGKVMIGEENIFYSGTRILSEGGEIVMGSKNEIGEQSAGIKSVNDRIEIKDECRVMSGAQIGDGCYLGNGAQVLGTIRMTRCILLDGKSYRERNPNKRGGVLKGSGVAGDLSVGVGMVISGNGHFSINDLVPQERNHPNWMNE